MFALCALLCFVLALFKVTIGTIDLEILGFAFLALHFLITIPIPWRGRPVP